MARTSPRRVAAMPKHHPRLLHLMPYGIGDSLRALWLLVLSRCWGIDQNGQVDLHHVVWILHWPRIGRNGYRWLWTGERTKRGREVRRRLTKAERDRLIQHCPTGWVQRLRSRRLGGRRPYTAMVHMRRLADLNAKRVAKGKPEKVWALEVKGNPLWLLAAPWLYLRRCATTTGVLMVAMTLQRNQLDSARALHVLRLAHHVLEVPVAVLPRAAKPANWTAEWEPLGVQVWGRWR